MAAPPEPTDKYVRFQISDFQEQQELEKPSNNNQFQNLLDNVMKYVGYINEAIELYKSVKKRDITYSNGVILLLYCNIIINILTYNNTAYELLCKYYLGQFLFRQIPVENYKQNINYLLEIKQYNSLYITFIFGELTYIIGTFNLDMLKEIKNEYLVNFEKVILLTQRCNDLFNSLEIVESEKKLTNYDLSTKVYDINFILEMGAHYLEKHKVNATKNSDKVIVGILRLNLNNKKQQLRSERVHLSRHSLGHASGQPVEPQVEPQVEPVLNASGDNLHTEETSSKKKSRKKKKKQTGVKEAIPEHENMVVNTESEDEEAGIPKIIETANNVIQPKAINNAEKETELRSKIEKINLELEEVETNITEAKANVKKYKKQVSDANNRVIKLKQELDELNKELHFLINGNDNPDEITTEQSSNESPDESVNLEQQHVSRSKLRTLRRKQREQEQAEVHRINDLMSASHVSKPKLVTLDQQEIAIEDDPFLASNKFNITNDEVTEIMSINEYYSCLRAWKQIEEDDTIIGNQKIYAFLSGQIQKNLVYFEQFLQEKQMDSKLTKKPTLYDMQSIFYYGLHTVRTLVKNDDININVSSATNNNIILAGVQLPKDIVIVDMLNVFYQVHPEMVGQHKDEQLITMTKFKKNYYKILQTISANSGIVFICICIAWNSINFKMLHKPYDGVFEILTKYNIKSALCIDKSDKAQYSNTISAEEYFKKPHKYKIINWGNCDDSNLKDTRFRILNELPKSVQELFGFNSMDDITIAILWWLLYVNGYNVSILSNDNFAWLRLAKIGRVHLNFKFGSHIEIPDTYKKQKGRVTRIQIIDYLYDMLEKDKSQFDELIESCKSEMPNVMRIKSQLQGMLSIGKTIKGGMLYKLNNKRNKSMNKPKKNIKL